MGVPAETAMLADVLFERAGVGLCLVGPDDVVLRANAEWLRSTGLAREQVIGRDIVALFPETRDLARALHGRARAGQPVPVPRHAQRVGGRETWWEGSIAPVPLEGGTGLLITAREISDEHALLAAIVQQLPAGVVLAEAPSGRIVLGNAEVERIFGHGILPSQSTADYARWKAFHPGGAQLESHEHVLARALAGETVTEEAVEIERGDGARALLSVNGAPIRDAQGAIRAAVVVFTDVTERKRAEEALRRTEALLQHASAMARLGAWWIEISGGDLHGSPLRWSEEVYRIFGYEPGAVEVSNALFFEHVHPADRQRVADAVAQARASGRPYVIEHRIVAHGGAERTVLEYGSFQLEAGAPVRLVGAVQDVTDRRRAEEAARQSEATLEAFFAASPGILNITDDALRYVKTDPLTPTYFGLTRESIVGRSLEELAPPFVARFGPMLRRVVETERPELNVEVESPVSSRPGESTFWRASYFPVPLPGGRRGIGVMGVEITDMKKAEAALREADRRKDEYLAMLSHEIRNPLAPICNSLFILDRVDPAGDQGRRAVAVIRRQAEHLTRLVDDLLDVTRVARGKIELRRARIDLRVLVAQAAEDARPGMERRGVRFTVSLPDAALRADADATRITQVVGNLLHNAAKFTRPGDEVVLTLRATPGEAEIRVRDTGVGIEPALLPRVFDPFVQEERTLARTEGGLGIGLALVKGITELHGGTVRVESGGKGTGAEFIVRLPLAEPGAGR